MCVCGGGGGVERCLFCRKGVGLTEGRSEVQLPGGKLGGSIMFCLTRLYAGTGVFESSM